MKYLIRIALWTALGILCTEGIFAQRAINIQGTIADFKNGDVILFDALTRDTLAKGKIVDHRFTLVPCRGEVRGQALPAMVMCLKDDRKQSSAAPIAIENTNLTIDLSGAGRNQYGGSPLQIKYSIHIGKLKEVDDVLAATKDERKRDSLRSMIAQEVEGFYLQTRNTSFNNFAALIVYDFLARKLIDPISLLQIQRMCADSITRDTFDQMICEAVSGFHDQWEGRKAPDFTAKSSSGEEVKFSELIGSRPVIIDFWASWCGPCIQEMPALKSIASTYNVTIIGVSLDDQVAAWEKTLVRLELPWINIRDVAKTIATDYHVTAIPTKFVIDKSGIIVAHNPEDLIAILESLKE